MSLFLHIDIFIIINSLYYEKNNSLLVYFPYNPHFSTKLSQLEIHLRKISESEQFTCLHSLHQIAVDLIVRHSVGHWHWTAGTNAQSSSMLKKKEQSNSLPCFFGVPDGRGSRQSSLSRYWNDRPDSMPLSFCQSLLISEPLTDSCILCQAELVNWTLSLLIQVWWSWSPGGRGVRCACY